MLGEMFWEAILQGKQTKFDPKVAKIRQQNLVTDKSFPSCSGFEIMKGLRMVDEACHHEGAGEVIGEYLPSLSIEVSRLKIS